MVAATALKRVFAANRSAGRLALTVAAADGVTRRKRVYEDGPLRARFPNTDGDALEAVIVNIAGGIAGGDSHAFDISLGERPGAAEEPFPVALVDLLQEIGVGGIQEQIESAVAVPVGHT